MGFVCIPTSSVLDNVITRGGHTKTKGTTEFVPLLSQAAISGELSPRNGSESRAVL